METQTESQTAANPKRERNGALHPQDAGAFAKEPDLDKRWNALRPILAELLADPHSHRGSEAMAGLRAGERPRGKPYFLRRSGLRLCDQRPHQRRGAARLSAHAFMITRISTRCTACSTAGRESCVMIASTIARNPNYAEIRESSNVLVSPGEIDLVKPYEIHTELTVGERTVAVIIRSQKGGDFNQGRYIPEENKYYESRTAADSM